MVGPVLMVAAQINLISDSSADALLGSCLLIGISNGTLRCLAPLITGKLFGPKFEARNFGCIALGTAVFGLLFTCVLDPLVYDAHSQDSTRFCSGSGCFASTHLVVAGAGVLAFVCTLWL